ncbi:hypothetical protein B1J93_13355 [Leptospira kirschneri serovar Pomona]|uniref:Uncharacterized protein n=1 Tax=Leptospira kirschneri serovar Pomona TaxID=561005 RepID=A0A1T1DK77_9LEPT|nr:hypothetical protein B1J93_13355 [Leptospira kirschneri serovar Pomona]OOV48567.1 hypothetical protein B1J94_10775 [Leptospira kirschneri serovar Grippotyphosa]
MIISPEEFRIRKLESDRKEVIFLLTKIISAFESETSKIIAKMFQRKGIFSNDRMLIKKNHFFRKC